MMPSKTPQPSKARSRTGSGLITFWIALGALQLSNCTSMKRKELAPANPLEEPTRTHPDPQRDDIALAARAREILDARCVGCHGCYDAPCQLKLTSFEGIERGATKLAVYDATRSRAIPPTRLGVDAHGVPAWRMLGFHSVLGVPKNQAPTSQILRRMLDLKKNHPLPAGVYLPAGMKVGIDRKHTCPDWDEMADYEREHRLWGMPYALPGLSDEEDAALRTWLDAGAPIPASPSFPEDLQRQLVAVETWLNSKEPGRPLVARYIYEHLFLASLFFGSSSHHPKHWFRLIRSLTPSDQPPREVVTRLSIDPVQGPVYYRLVPRTETVLSKTHLTYHMGPSRLRRWSALFASSTAHDKRPAPASDHARSNPFRSFSSISMAARYKFLLDDAGFFLGGFIKGPVCRGQTALNVIQDRFWVLFLNPDSQVSQDMSEFLEKMHEELELPAEDGSQSSMLRWIAYATQHQRYLEAKRRFVKQESGRLPRQDGPLWKGYDFNPNAALTVFRHHDSATVVQGLVGSNPKTSWLLSYPELERIHYLLVAGFDVFGNIGHQVNTRLYMDFLRMEGEYNFLLLVDEHERTLRVKSWYRNVGGLKKYWISKHLDKTKLKGVWEHEGIHDLHQVYSKLKGVLRKVDRSGRWNLSVDSSDAVQRSLAALALSPPAAATQLPEMTLVLVRGETDRLFTILRESAYANVARLLLDSERRRPSEDRLEIVQGVLGSYPNALLQVDENEVQELVDAIQHITREGDYARLLSRFGVRRTDPNFWEFSDRIHAAFARIDPIEYGRLDYNRLENR